MSRKRRLWPSDKFGHDKDVVIDLDAETAFLKALRRENPPACVEVRETSWRQPVDGAAAGSGCSSSAGW